MGSAERMETGQAEGLISPRLDTGIVNLFLAQFSATLAPDVQAVLVWDGAGYHRANDLRCPLNITLMNLPPYSPELNPVENLWHYPRSHHWSNRKYATVDDLFDAAETAWRAACLDPAVIQTVCHAPYAETRCYLLGLVLGLSNCCNVGIATSHGLKRHFAAARFPHLYKSLVHLRPVMHVKE